ncbi:MAG: biopolymer transporter ExbD [Bacteroidales bacterium]|nr:biopolymer transporter ExbD [Bacteroidales bacterium]MCF8390716.1 biopolymer transporter ExbD [Bacteroidales bacterium]
MSIRSKHKVNVNYSMSGMTDIVFLLLIFFMLTSTLIAPNALKLLFPQKGQAVVTTTHIPVIELYSDGKVALDGRIIAFENLESLLISKLAGQADPTVSFIIEGNATVKETVNVMNIAAQNNIKVVLKEKI